jgi:hypothetical protein
MDIPARDCLFMVFRQNLIYLDRQVKSLCRIRSSIPDEAKANLNQNSLFDLPNLRHVTSKGELSDLTLP